MIRAAKAIVDKHGHARLLEEVKLPEDRRALVTVSGLEV
jgi:hypothetical protein